MTKMSPKRDGRPAMRSPRALEHRARRTAHGGRRAVRGARRSPKQRKGAEEPKAVNALAGAEGEGRKAAASWRASQKRPDRGSCPAKVR
ncbi:hypothetical protein Y034_4391 [Burkholderia pseudomallei MSHR449]|nr:hypothetical protein Y034_4391 [Burkholderia pseudomallei MSHR449]